MQMTISSKEVQKLIGKTVYAVKKDGTTVSGKLVRISGNKLVMAPEEGKVQTSALAPLVLFDLLAIGTSPFAFGGFDGFGGFGFPFGGFGGGFF
ncbi:hypothetical protein [Paenibacillus sp. UNC451MF]|uniref:hypothetical protein n=1 Tax=Paenibacillus sp. UNC451MF TaxID=1449063 RepID=UPI00048E96D3|nr:hypothetical protein [Paenibacillus sp. UNC451MF]